MRFLSNRFIYVILGALAAWGLAGAILDTWFNGAIRIPYLITTVLFWSLLACFQYTHHKYLALMRKCFELEMQTMAAITFANALAERSVTIPCDDCGNPMDANTDIAVMPRPEGGIYVGHRTHQRAKDWGYA